MVAAFAAILLSPRGVGETTVAEPYPRIVVPIHYTLDGTLQRTEDVIYERRGDPQEGRIFYELAPRL